MAGRYDVKAFGGVGDGSHNDTFAIQSAIDVCGSEGGGQVILSSGIFVAGGLYLKSNVFIYVDISAVLKASGDIDDYGEDTHYNRYRNEKDLDRCWIYAQDAENIGICGYGEINGNAEAFPNEGSIYRPMMIRFLRCRNIHISEVRLYNAAAWTTAFLECEFVWVRGVDIRNEYRYNGDGLDFDGCSHVYISDCSIKGTDDNLCLQAGDKAFPMQDVHITNCEFTSVCAAIRIGLKSIGTISNVVISNCTMRNVWREGIKIECTEGGSITDILVQNVVMRNVSRPIFVILNNRFEPQGLGSSIDLVDMPEIGELKRIQIMNLIATDDEEMSNTHRRFDKDMMGSPSFSGIRFDAAKEHPIEEVMLQNIRYTFIGGVKLSDIPKEYPEVQDMKKLSMGRRKYSDKFVSENYFPDWSRAAFMDIRNVKHLTLGNMFFKALNKDEREPVILENCIIDHYENFYEVCD